MESAYLQMLFGGLTVGSIYAMLGVGLTLIHRTSGIINFAQGELSVFAVLFAASVIGWTGWPLPVVILVAILFACGLGLVFERTVVNPIRFLQPWSVSLVTLAAAIALQGVIMLLWGKSAIPFPTLSKESVINVAGATIQVQSLWIIGLTAVLVVLLHLFLERTNAGRAMTAVAESPSTASLMGIDPRIIVAFSFIIGASLAAVAGLLVAPITNMSFDYGVRLTIKGMIAAVLGGFDNISGPIVGGLVLGIAEMLAAGLISSLYKDVFAFAIIILLLYVRRGGILGAQQA
ncbi:MAG: branched-chain amino acid ABC transporter permease [Chloroflexota bacterium]|nr:MAG: branched-chain amino acid ABC transporter permease [Chloroflexota bacterium]